MLRVTEALDVPASLVVDTVDVPAECDTDKLSDATLVVDFVSVMLSEKDIECDLALVACEFVMVNEKNDNVVSGLWEDDEVRNPEGLKVADGDAADPLFVSK